MLYFANGDRFDGSWTEDRKNGPGSYYYRDGSVLMGEWKEGALEGYALICGADGSLDPGYWEKGTRAENGAQLWTSGDTQYFGIQENGTLQGKGIAIEEEAESYRIGEFETGSFRTGTIFMNQSRYEGTCQEGAWMEGWQYFYDRYGKLYGIPFANGMPGETAEDPGSLK